MNGHAAKTIRRFTLQRWYILDLKTQMRPDSFRKLNKFLKKIYHPGKRSLAIINKATLALINRKGGSANEIKRDDKKIILIDK